MPSSERHLMDTQAGLAAMLEANQNALVGHLAALLVPIQLELAELHALVEAMGRQIDQIHERQEAHERASRGEP